MQWQKIYGILENAIYGGRVDNIYDTRVLRAYIENLFNDSSLKGRAKLSELLVVPQSGQVKDYNQTMQGVPDSDQPNLFGLPANIDRSVQRFNSTFVINQLK